MLSCTIQSSHAYQNGAEQARDFIASLGDQVIAVVTDSNISQQEKEKKLNELFSQSVDIDWIAKFVTGRYWRELQISERDDYFDTYRKFLINSYVSKFTSYTGQKMEIERVFEEARNEYMVETSINEKEGNSYRVSYRIRLGANGNFSIYDIIAEGVSLITTQRSEFGSILAREGMPSLIAKLKQKI